VSSAGPKLRCPRCGRYTSRVMPRSDLQRDDEAYRRVRQCLHCLTRYVTAERVERVVRPKAA
jgi:transcriptional regulator NrdR family protein